MPKFSDWFKMDYIPRKPPFREAISFAALGRNRGLVAFLTGCVLVQIYVMGEYWVYNYGLNKRRLGFVF